MAAFTVRAGGAGVRLAQREVRREARPPLVARRHGVVHALLGGGQQLVARVQLERACKEGSAHHPTRMYLCQSHEGAGHARARALIGDAPQQRATTDPAKAASQVGWRSLHPPCEPCIDWGRASCTAPPARPAPSPPPRFVAPQAHPARATLPRRPALRRPACALTPRGLCGGDGQRRFEGVLDVNLRGARRSPQACRHDWDPEHCMHACTAAGPYVARHGQEGMRQSLALSQHMARWSGRRWQSLTGRREPGEAPAPVPATPRSGSGAAAVACVAASQPASQPAIRRGMAVQLQMAAARRHAHSVSQSGPSCLASTRLEEGPRPRRLGGDGDGRGRAQRLERRGAVVKAKA